MTRFGLGIALAAATFGCAPPPQEARFLSVGDDVAVGSWTVRQGALPSRSFVALLAGDCSTCTNFSALTRGLPTNVVLLFRAPVPKKVALPSRTTVAFVPGDVYDRINPLGVPRLALISVGGKLSDLQSVEDSASAFLKRCGR